MLLRWAARRFARPGYPAAMYLPFFGLSQPPFSIAPDPRYLYMSERHREALAHLLYGVGGGGGFVLLSGEIGAGKTTVCRCFLEQLPPGCQAAYIFNPRLSETELLQSVCDEFGLVVAGATVKTYLDVLNRHLLEAHAQGRHCVLIIDEAQNLSAELLEQLRLLTNLETHERKLLQIMLIGQPELRRRLAEPGLEQLAQRVIARYHLGALSAPETAAYLAHRLAVAGHAGAMPFDPAALRHIHRLSAGLPRRINLLADRALLGAYALGRAQVGRRIVEQAAHEVFDTAAAVRRPGWRFAAWCGAAGLLLAGAGFWFGQAMPSGAVRAASVPSLAPSGAAPAFIAASASALAAPPAVLPPLDGVQGLAPRDEAAAWRELAGLWGLDAVAIGGADLCQSLRTGPWRCFRTGSSTLALLRQLDRPGFLVLRGADGQGRPARLVSLGARRAVLAIGGQTYGVPLDQLASLWRGEFGTLWRSPPGYGDALAPKASGPAVDSLARGLAVWQQDRSPAPGQVLVGALAERLAGFQVSQSLRPDGIAGPTTFMQLNRVQGLVEPRLSPDLVER